MNIKTLSGRDIPAPPKIIFGEGNRKCCNSIKKLNIWLREQAIEEARARKDEFNLLIFESEKVIKGELQQATKDGMALYLFGEEFPEWDATTGERIT